MLENSCFYVFFVFVSEIAKLARIVVESVFILQNITVVAAERIIHEIRHYDIFVRTYKFWQTYII